MKKRNASKPHDVVESFAAEVRRNLQAPGADQVHDLRVAIRKFAQALVLFGDSSGNKIRRGLKRLMHRAGDVRDYDITLELALEMKAPKGFLARVQTKRDAAGAVLKTALQKWEDSNQWRNKLAAKPASAQAAKVANRSVKQLFKRGSAAQKSNKKLHPLRIATKKLRYTLELLNQADPDSFKGIKDLQSQLGDINDYATARRIARSESAGKRIEHDLSRKQRKKTGEFRRFWKNHFAGTKRKWKAQAAPSRSPKRERQGAA
jgi:CHAD domain-containing protein